MTTILKDWYELLAKLPPESRRDARTEMLVYLLTRSPVDLVRAGMEKLRAAHPPTVTVPSAPGDLHAGDYVLATKWSDADWNDPWGIGFVKDVFGYGVTIANEDGSDIEGIGSRVFRNAVRINAQCGKLILEKYPPCEGTAFQAGVLAGIFSESGMSSAATPETV